jgi:hypothetical protein
MVLLALSYPVYRLIVARREPGGAR